MSESETERLRRRLEELGVFCLPYPENDQHTPRLCWKVDDDHDGYCYFFEDDFHVTELLMTALTAEQAIEATIGQAERTCSITDLNSGEVADYECREHIKHCESCHHDFGYVLYNEDGDTWMDEQPRYCPNCGAKVVQE